MVYCICYVSLVPFRFFLFGRVAYFMRFFFLPYLRTARIWTLLWHLFPSIICFSLTLTSLFLLFISPGVPLLLCGGCSKIPFWKVPPGLGPQFLVHGIISEPLSPYICLLSNPSSYIISNFSQYTRYSFYLVSSKSTNECRRRR